MQTGNTDNSDASGFTYVTRPSKRKAKNKARTGVPALSLASLLNESRRQLHETKHWQDCVAYVDDLPDEPLIHKALCLGLGSPTASVNAREQLLLFMELLKHFHIDSHTVTVYDPVFSEEDRKGLKELGFEISEENKKGRYPVDERTLVYMPHCGKRLYENLYRANWSKIQLSSLVLVGNDLQGYEEGTPKAKFEAQTPCLARILPYLQVIPFPPTTISSAAFNHLSTQYLAHNQQRLEILSNDKSFSTSGRVRPFTELDESFWVLPNDMIEDRDDCELL